MASPSPAPVFLRGPQGENNALVHNLTSLCSDFYTSFKASGYTLEETFSWEDEQHGSSGEPGHPDPCRDPPDRGARLSAPALLSQTLRSHGSLGWAPSDGPLPSPSPTSFQSFLNWLNTEGRTPNSHLQAPCTKSDFKHPSCSRPGPRHSRIKRRELHGPRDHHSRSAATGALTPGAGGVLIRGQDPWMRCPPKAVRPPVPTLRGSGCSGPGASTGGLLSQQQVLMTERGGGGGKGLGPGAD